MYEEILEKVLEKVRPSPEEYESRKRTLEEFLNTLRNTEHLFERVEVAGSFVRNTHLRGKHDVDVFLLYPKGTPMELMEREVMEIASLFPHEVRYAQHPYARITYKDLEIDLVPAYMIEEGERPLSATDRTPLHNRFVLEHLEEWQKDEVRLLKQFMKGIGVYGAEIKVEGFSGYLCELLVIKYGDFLSVLRASAEWKPGTRVVIKEDKVREKRPLIVPDPVDPYRNVAYSVSPTSFSVFVAASKHFLHSPSITFFFPRLPVFSRREVAREISRRKGWIIAVKTVYPEDSPDNVWGQLKRFRRLLVKKMEGMNNDVVYSDVYTDESTYTVTVMEIVRRHDSVIHTKEGPPVYSGDHVVRFLERHREDFIGPYIEGYRLLGVKEVYERSPLIETHMAVRDILKERSVGEKLLNALEDAVILEGRDVARLYNLPGFPEFITHFLRRKLRWLY